MKGWIKEWMKGWMSLPLAYDCEACGHGIQVAVCQAIHLNGIWLFVNKQGQRMILTVGKFLLPRVSVFALSIRGWMVMDRLAQYTSTNYC